MFEVEVFERDIGPDKEAASIGIKASGLASMNDAEREAQRLAGGHVHSGQNKEQGYWWGRDADAITTMIYVPQGSLS